MLKQKFSSGLTQFLLMFALFSHPNSFDLQGLLRFPQTCGVNSFDLQYKVSLSYLLQGSSVSNHVEYKATKEKGKKWTSIWSTWRFVYLQTFICTNPNLKWSRSCCYSVHQKEQIGFTILLSYCAFERKYTQKLTQIWMHLLPGEK